ncbi:MAG: hypothetical protein GWO16_11540, partial [Gammaproteobacteria bacterium]|nr:hypothetical protein [Gammaproteobacteria bacterium]NIR98567.1 hypothetical protein [Gammaproteobacteria bacterium]NIT64285.1 hypothetical protein [Gammaproteobacteria bacterium]NIV21215.1 hypothetical protein [Gammaproteobacteria bacterium]NIY32865.1 hypothetical protein [Gammaproteobacteria bacterium]
ALRTRLGSGTFRTLSRGVPWHRLLGADPPSEDWERLAGAHHTHLLKIVDCPERPEFTWGSRGVFFGDRSASRWREALEAAMHGRVPGVGVCRNVHYAACELIESDRFDVPFLHPAGDALALMPRARIRMTPIYFRHGHKVRMLAGHATFVNTSRKIHLGRHAVCVPLDWEPTPQAPGTHPETTPPGMAKPGARPREAGLA